VYWLAIHFVGVVSEMQPYVVCEECLRYESLFYVIFQFYVYLEYYVGYVGCEVLFVTGGFKCLAYLGALT